jgi:UDP-hydrolysing UDP-N-acetyl-D-glucosamine 2-epimerase
MLRIGVFTGSRANYSSTKTIIRALDKDPRTEVVSIVGGAATLARYGKIDKVMVSEGLPKPHFTFNMFIDGESHADMAKSCGLGLMEMSTILSNVELDALLVVGDRYDVMAPVIAAAYMNIPIIHTMGGEVTGTIDESIRHAITKFAHLHLVANDDAKARVEKMGEHADTVINVGCPRMDLVKEAVETDLLNTSDMYNKYRGVGTDVSIDDDFLLVSFHPVTTEAEDIRNQVNSLLEALSYFELPTIMLWPNFDAGGSEVAKAIRTFRENKSPEWLNVQTNFSVEDYSRLLNRTRCLVGNSSSGVREGAFLGTPVVNIGTRQQDRLKASNVVDCGYESSDIIESIEKQLSQKKYPSSGIYGDGMAAEKIIEAVLSADFSKVQKKINY